MAGWPGDHLDQGFRVLLFALSGGRYPSPSTSLRFLHADSPVVAGVWWCRGGLVAQRAVLPCTVTTTKSARDGRAGTGRQTSCYVGSGLAAKLKSCYGPMALSEALRFLGPQQNCRKCIQISKNGLLSPFSARPVGTAVHASRGSTCKSLAAMVDVTTQSLRGDHRRFLRIIMRRVRRLA